jgi:NADH:ubiquinone oxidoreductase subunit 3 (subunit A)
MTSLIASLLLFVAVGAGFIFVHLVAGKFFRPNKPGAEKATIYECGEPTIGSAWIQFDLRFYVVALLFVIFDVEVAFFFPWAEVFGKANAVVAATPDRTKFAAIKEISIRGRDLVPDNHEKAAGRELLQVLGEMDEAEFNELKSMVSDKSPGRAEYDKIAKIPGTKSLQFYLQEKSRAKLADLPDTPENAGKRRPHRALLALDTRQFEELSKEGTPFRKLPPEGLEDVATLSRMALWEIAIFFGVLLVGFAYLWRRGDLAWVRALQAPQVQPVETLVTPVAEPSRSVNVVESTPAGAHH